LPGTTSQYTRLTATLINPDTKKDVRVELTDDFVDPVLDEDGQVTFDSQDRPLLRAKVHTKQFFWSEETVRNDRAYNWFRFKIFTGRTVSDVCSAAWFWAIMIFALGSMLYPVIDMFTQHDYLKGEMIRGTHKLSPREYAHQHRKDAGYGFTVHSAEATGWVIRAVLRLAALAGFAPPSYPLRVPREMETQGLLVLGDPGTGKSQIFHRLIMMIRRRSHGEALVCYDPEGEFVKKHFNPKTDFILNPLDKRFRFWSPAFEVNYQNANASAVDRKMIADALFPDRRYGTTTVDFFINAARGIFSRILEVEQNLARIIEILTSEDLIDQIVAGTEYAHLISPGAKGQRGGVLATLSEIGESLKLLPPQEQCRGAISLTQWARKRQGRIFITSRHDTRDALGRLQAAWINILMKRLLAADPDWGMENPCWVIVDEVHALKQLSALPSAIEEGRKHGLKLAIGTQNKAQLEEYYGHRAASMLAAFHTKIILRCNEPECARWLSDLIGEDETERPRLSTTASVQRHGRDSVQYNQLIERRAVVSKEEIMSLPNLQGYWKLESVVVPFRIEPLALKDIAYSFIERKSSPAITPVSYQRPVMLPHENGKDTLETPTRSLDEIDISF
jgi:hypothetical protein